MKRKPTQPKLLNYSLMAAGFLAVSAPSQADVIYTDVDPDVVLVNATYDIDMNGDGVIDFTVSQNGYNYSSMSYGYTYISSYYFAALSPASGADFVGQPGLSYPLSSVYFVNALNSGAVIGSTAIFAGYSYGYFGGRGYYFYGTASTGFSTNISYGFWDGVTDKFAGVRFLIGANTHYGWIRCDVTTGFDQITIKDFAYENVPGAPIIAGDTVGVPISPADLATTLSLADVADNANGLDLQLDFVKAADETTIDEYRLLVVKSPDAATFTLADAVMVAPANYLALSPTGSDVSTNFGAAGRDVDGDLIIEGVAYRSFVLSMADGTVANVNSLSAASNEVTLSTFSAPADVVLSLTAIDNSDFADGRDVLVSFDPAVDESTVADYRIAIVKESAAAGFDAVAGAALTGARVKSVAPTGASVMTSLSATSEDADGDLIQEGVSYQAFVVSMPDGVNATDPTLSTPSLPFTLGSTTGLESPEVAGIQVVSANGAISISQEEAKELQVKVFSLGGQLVATKSLNGNDKIYSHLFSAGEIVLVHLAGKEEEFVTTLLIR